MSALPIPWCVVCLLSIRGCLLLKLPSVHLEGGDRLDSFVTFADLFQYTLVLIGLAGLFLMGFNNKKKK